MIKILGSTFMTDFGIFQAVANYIDNTKNNKSEKSVLEITLLSMLAGIFISLGAFVSVNVGVDLPLGLAKFLGGLTFSAGLIMVVLLGAELFTGNVLTTFHFIKNGFSVKSFMKLWVLVYIGNLIGSMLAVYLLAHSGLASNLQEKFNGIAQMKTSLTFLEALTRGIFCNFLVCVAILIGNQAKTVQGKVFGIMVPITIFIASGYEHSVANMFFLPMGHATLSGFFNNIIPVTIGNILGAWLLIGLLYYSYSHQKPSAAQADNILIAKEQDSKTFTKV